MMLAYSSTLFWLQVPPLLGTCWNCKSELNTHFKVPQKDLCAAGKNCFNYTSKTKKSPQSVQFKSTKLGEWNSVLVQLPFFQS